MLINPVVEDAGRFFKYELNGNISVASGLSPSDAERANYTIKAFNLNEASLSERRKTIINIVLDTFENLSDESILEALEAEGFRSVVEQLLDERKLGEDSNDDQKVRNGRMDTRFFRRSKVDEGQVILMRNIQNKLYDLNPKERDMFMTVANELIDNGYFTYEEGSPQVLRLTKKGCDYIYNPEAKLDCCYDAQMLSTSQSQYLKIGTMVS